MRTNELLALSWSSLRRSLRRLGVAMLGIALGVGTLAFFVALGAGLREVVLGRIFPIDRVEIVPPSESAGALAALVGGEMPEPAGITEETVRALRATEGVRAVYPKMRLSFPSSGRGGREVLGRNVGTGELVVDGIEPALVQGELDRNRIGSASVRFDDPGPGSGRACTSDEMCDESERCTRLLDEGGVARGDGSCAPPIPAVVSPYLVEVFDGAIAPAHRLPPLGQLLLRASEGFVLEWDLGRAGLGMATRGTQRRVHVRIVGVTSRAIDLGFTVPIAVARRLNGEYAGPRASREYTSAVVVLAHPSDTVRVAARVRSLGLELRTSGAEQMGLLVAVVTAVLSLSSVLVVLLAALNIAHAFASLVAERRGELGLLRALGATRGDVRAIVLVQAAVVGIASTGAGLLLARLAAWGWNRAAMTRLPAFPFKPSDWFVWEGASIAGVALFGVGACVLCALAPASRAAKTDPAAALSQGV